MNPLTKELLRQLVQEDVVDEEAVFIDLTKPGFNATSASTFLWRQKKTISKKLRS
ncbi:hypothetical protein U0355_11265 [Salimicrobium sp. PL1-032A]|uniref:hypothetical protein n=1 Tax=Salimicrobium sp. PL1-032A TaxID=3095364 RepID=UPI0032603A00